MTEQKLIRIVVINATKRDARAFAIPADKVSDVLRQALTLPIGDMITTAHQFDDKNTLYVNDEGLIHASEADEPVPSFMVCDAEGNPVSNPFVGNGVILGCDEMGETVDTTLEEINLRYGNIPREVADKLLNQFEITSIG